MYDSITQLERDLSRLVQYGRRESIEIHGIPESVKPQQLESTAIKILKFIGVKVESYDIVAVHRLKTKGRDGIHSTIVRFINRKNAYTAKKNKKQLMNIHTSNDNSIKGMKKLFIVENLCTAYKKLFNKCRDLKRNHEYGIKHLWTYNGTINIRFSDDKNENPIQISHMEDYEYYFPDEIKREDIIYSENEEN